MDVPGRARSHDLPGTIDDWVAKWRGPTAHLLQWVAVVMITLVAMAEIDRLIAGSLGVVQPGLGNSAPLGGAIGPTALAERDSWAIWSSNEATRGSVGGWIFASIAIDLVFIAGYRWLFLALIGSRASTDRKPAHESRLRWLVRFDLAENGFLAIGAAMLVAGATMGRNAPLAWAVGAAATMKWILLALLLIGLGRDPEVRGVVKRVVRRLAQALWLHRLSALLVAALFAVSCLPFDGVLDQLPDIQRQWVGPDWYHAIFATGAVAVGSFAAFALGRARTRTLIDVNVRRMVRYEAPTWTSVRWWLAPVAICLLLWLYAAIVADAWPLGPGIVVFVALPAAALLLSLSPKAGVTPEPRDDAVGRAQYAWLTGDVIAVALWITAGVGLVRSFTGPVFLGWFDTPASEPDPAFTAGGWWWAVGFLVAGIAVAVVSPLLLQRMANGAGPAWTDPRTQLVVPKPGGPPPSKDDDETWKGHRRRLGLFFGVGVGLLLLFALFPLQISGFLGAVTMTVLTLTAWGAVLGAFTLALQDYLPLRVFRRMRLRAAPVLTMAITIPLIAGTAFSELGWDDTRLHSVRRDNSTVSWSADGEATGGEAHAPESSSVDDLVTALRSRVSDIGEQGCTLPGTSAVPVVIFVAEGGGIRAAYWTTKVLEKLKGSTGCLATSTLLSSGVSGGSVGIAIAGSDAIGDDATDTLKNVASPDTVSTGVTGLLVSDLIASATGVRVPSWFEFEPGWRDRAALIELTWQADVEEFEAAADFTADPLVGLPMLNSTDARTKCRVPVTAVPVAGDDFRCAQPVGAPAATLPILDPCVASLDWASAAMLSARFPIITPAGRLGDGDGDRRNDDACGTQTRQLIDGGYAEGSGLGTAADLAPLVGSVIRDENAERDSTFLVPILVFAQNSAGYDLSEDLRAVSSEPLVPLVGAAAAATQTTKSAWTQRISTAFSQACPTVEAGGADATQETTALDEPEAMREERERQEAERAERSVACAAALDTVEQALPGQVVVVAPSTKPTVVPPLGWALSSFSIASMDRSLTDQVDGTHTAGVADLADLFALAGKSASR